MSIPTNMQVSLCIAFPCWKVAYSKLQGSDISVHGGSGTVIGRIMRKYRTFTRLVAMYKYRTASSETVS